SVVLDRIRSGEFMLGVCTGLDSIDTDLQSEILMVEPMVIIPSSLKKLRWRRGQNLPVISIEDHSGAWRSFGDAVTKLGIVREVALESFFSVAQLAIAGFGHALVPIGVARTLGVSDKLLINLGNDGLNRPVRFVARKSTYSLPVVANFYKALKSHLQTSA
ncbi:MAG: substrate-binding domain-containing protein, partial [Proteobacteria bacterium]|nr:substrate-binding domain-containing protein [Pseudomonadota bacterium]